MIVILFIALSYIELGAMFPEAGGMVKYTQYSHGSFVGFLAPGPIGLPLFLLFLLKQSPLCNI